MVAVDDAIVNDSTIHACHKVEIGYTERVSETEIVLIFVTMINL